MATMCPFCLVERPRCSASQSFPDITITLAGPRDPGSLDRSVHRETREGLVWGEGCPERCHCMILGEAPGEWEQHWGRPFIGDSGRRLMEQLARRSRSDFYITNVYKLWPRDRGGKTRSPNQAEANAHGDYLSFEMNAVNPCFVLLLGETAIKAVVGRKGYKGMKHYWGHPHFSQGGREYFATSHPSRGGAPFRNTVASFAQACSD